MQIKHLRFALPTLLLSIMGCGDPPTGNGPAASVTVLPENAAVAVGGSVQLTAVLRDTSGNILPSRAVNWLSDNTEVASVSASGLVATSNEGSVRVSVAVEGFTDTVTVTVLSESANIIALDPATTFQTMLGWEATAQAGQWFAPSFPQYQNELYNRVVDELGINRVRLEIHSGTENPVDYFQMWQAGQISFDEWRDHWYDIVNDDANPNGMNSGGFSWGWVDSDAADVVVPLKQRVEANGEQLYINLCYVDFGTSEFEHSQNPEEYAELMLAAFQHLQATYGWVPDAIEMLLEPDNTDWTPTQVGEALVSTGDLLAANGFFPDFIAPSTTNMGNAWPFFDEMLQVSGVLNYLTELSYHRYGGVSESNLTEIANRGISHGLQTSMIEHIGSGYEALHEDLTTGRNSSWSQFTIASVFSLDPDDGGKYYMIDDSNPSNPQVMMGQRTGFLSQYFKYIRRGAVRIEATSSSARFDPVAFINANGRYVVVVKSDGSGDFSLGGLPNGEYGIRYTVQAGSSVDLADFTVAGGGVLNTAIPGAGVITVFRR